MPWRGTAIDSFGKLNVCCSFDNDATPKLFPTPAPIDNYKFWKIKERIKTVKDSLGLVLIIISYPFLLDNLAIYEIKSSWLVYVIAFICIDFANHVVSSVGYKQVSVSV